MNDKVNELVERVDDLLWPKFLGDTARIRNQILFRNNLALMVDSTNLKGAIPLRHVIPLVSAPK